MEIFAVSIDDSAGLARSHVEKRAWTRTRNAWAGDGGVRAPAARPFRVDGIPTLYVIDAKGKIVQAGHPETIDLAAVVAKQLPPR